MINYDMHIHTKYCGHAPDMTIAAIISCAEKAGLETIAITSHVFCHDDLPLIACIRDEVADIKPNLRVIIGAEVDIDGFTNDGRLITEQLDNIDYILAGLHYIPGPGNLPQSPADNSLPPQLLFESWRSTLLGVLSNRRIDTLAHPGRMIATIIDFDFFNDMLKVFEEAAEISAENKIAWELNELTGSKIQTPFLCHWYKIFQIALDAGVKIIYGSDSHTPAAIGSSDFVDTVLAKLPENCLSMPQDI